VITRLHVMVIDTFSTRSKVTIFCCCVALLTMLGWLDVITGDYSLIVFYLIPVSLAAWFLDKRCGLFFCVLSVIVRFLADESVGGFSFAHSMLHYWNELIEFLFLLIMSLLFSALKKNLETEKQLASRDPLTGTLNRRSFFDLAEHEINRSRRYSLPFTVAYIDLDNFKKINDRLGHRAGDELLVTVVSTILANIRSTDMLARFGGDEFVVLLPETTGEAARTFLTKLHELLNAAMEQQGWEVTFSIGAATYNMAQSTVDEVIQQADELMYKVKNSGKNRFLHMEFKEEHGG